MFNFIHVMNLFVKTASLLTAVLVMAGTAWGQSSVEPLRKAYLKEIAAAKESYKKDIAALPGKYRSTLQKLEKKFVDQGDLDNVIILRKELERTKDMKEYPSSPGEGFTPGLRKIWANGAGYIEKRSGDLKVRMKQLDQQYASRLESLMRELTKSQKFDEALQVRKELKDVQSGKYHQGGDIETRKEVNVDLKQGDGFKDEVRREAPSKPVEVDPNDSPFD